MKAISLWQPWASALLNPALKRHETRHWRLNPALIGQRVAIHAAQRVVGRNDISPEADAAACVAFGHDWRRALPFGAFVGSVILTDCREMGLMVGGAEPAHEMDAIFGLWEAGRFAFRVDDVRILDNPIPAKGRQGWFSTDMVHP